MADLKKKRIQASFKRYFLQNTALVGKKKLKT